MKAILVDAVEMIIDKDSNQVVADVVVQDEFTHAMLKDGDRVVGHAACVVRDESAYFVL